MAIEKGSLDGSGEDEVQPQQRRRPWLRALRPGKSVEEAREEPDYEVALGREHQRSPSEVLRLQAGQRIYESLRHLQSRIVAAMPADGHMLIGVCSALEGEGRTTIAVALAEMLSDQYSRQTLLVDANLNRPQVHSLLEIQESPGLRDCMSRGGLMTTAIRWSGRYWVMPAGSDTTLLPDGPEDPWEVFRPLRSLFRVTIVDLPATNSRHSATLTPYWADSVVWVVKANSTPADLASDAMQLVGKDRILGVVLNGHQTGLPGWLDRLL